MSAPPYKAAATHNHNILSSITYIWNNRLLLFLLSFSMATLSICITFIFLLFAFLFSSIMLSFLVLLLQLCFQLLLWHRDFLGSMEKLVPQHPTTMPCRYQDDTRYSCSVAANSTYSHWSVLLVFICLPQLILILYYYSTRKSPKIQVLIYWCTNPWHLYLQCPQITHQQIYSYTSYP